MPEKKRKEKTEKQNAFVLYTQTLSEPENDAISSFFMELNERIALSDDEKGKIRTDFENALLYYYSSGATLNAALARLDIKNLGAFYIRPPILWFALDDAAKIYPLSIKHGQMAMYRLSVTFKSEVVPELLQMALTFTIKRFPTFATTVKKGFFWHYLDTAKRRYAIEPETDIPCRPIKISGSNSQSFRVLYFHNRVSVECFHILADGTGGLAFLKSLAAEYLRLLSGTTYAGADILDINGTPTQSEMSNEFPRAEKTETVSGFVDKPAVQMSGKLSKLKPCRILHFKMDAARLKEVAKGKNATVTVYILAQMLIAGKYATDEPSGNISIQVPVNMRKFYPSGTLRNFSMYCGVKLPLDRITDADAILEDISLQMQEKTSKQSMSEMMNMTERMVNMTRYIPLIIKAPIARIVYGFLGDKIFSNTLSNLGVVTAPPEMEEYIESIDAVLGGGQTNRAGCTMVTFGNTATLTITKMTADPSFEEKLYRLLAQDGIVPVVEGSESYEN